MACVPVLIRLRPAKSTPLVGLRHAAAAAMAEDDGQLAVGHQRATLRPRRAITRSTVFCDHAPPRGGSTPCSVSRCAMAREDRPAIDTRTGRSAASRAAAASAMALACAGLPSLTPRALAACEACVGTLRDHAALLLGERGVNVQGERIDVAAQRADDERHPLRHQAGDERDIARQPVELGDADLALRLFAAFSAAFSCGRRSSASAPLPVSISVNSATISKPSAWRTRQQPCAALRGQGRSGPAAAVETR